MLSVRCTGTAEQMFGAHIFFFLQALSHQWKGRVDYTTGITLWVPEGERPLIKKNETLRLPCAAPSLSCQQETGRWGESCLLWTSCPPMMPSSFKNKGLTKVHDYSVAHHASRPGRLTKQRDWTEGRRLTGRVNPRVNTAAQASIPQWMSCQGISSSRGSFWHTVTWHCEFSQMRNGTHHQHFTDWFMKLDRTSSQRFCVTNISKLAPESERSSKKCTEVGTFYLRYWHSACNVVHVGFSHSQAAGPRGSETQ